MTRFAGFDMRQLHWYTPELRVIPWYLSGCFLPSYYSARTVMYDLHLINSNYLVIFGI